MECQAKRYIILTFFAYFYEENERVSCMYGVEWEKLMMMIRVKDRSCGFAFICYKAEYPKVNNGWSTSCVRICVCCSIMRRDKEYK